MILPYSNLACGITEIYDCSVDELKGAIQRVKNEIYESYVEYEAEPEHGNLLLYVVNQKQGELEKELIRQRFKVLKEWTNIKTLNRLRLYGYEYWPE